MRVQRGNSRCSNRLWPGSGAALISLVICVFPTWLVGADVKPLPISSQVSSRPVVVEGVSVRQGDGKLTIDLQTNGTPNFKSFELDNPHRIVVDVINARLGGRQRHVKVDQANVKSVRLAQFSDSTPQTVRAVFETSGKITYTLTGEKNTVRLVVPIAEKVAAKPTVVEKPIKIEAVGTPAPTAPMPNASSLVNAKNRPATIVRNLETRKVGDNLIVQIRTDGMVRYKAFDLDHPQRLVVDLSAVNLRSPRRSLSLNEGDLVAVRLGQFSSEPMPTVRAVVEQTRKIPYHLESSSDGLSVIFPLQKPQSKPAASQLEATKTWEATTPTAARTAEKISSAPVVDVQTVTKPVVEPAAPPQAALIADSLRAKPVKAPEDWLALPEKLQAPSKPDLPVQGLAEAHRPELLSSSTGTPIPLTATDVMKEASPIQKTEVPISSHASVQAETLLASVQSPPTSSATVVVEKSTMTPEVKEVKKAESSKPALKQVAAKQAPPVRAKASAKHAMTPTHNPTPTPPVSSPTATSQSQVVAPSAGGAASSDIISLDLRDVDIRDFFRMIHEVSGLNVILDPSVRGTLTIALKDVPWEQALDIVLRNNQLGKQLEGNVLRIVTLKSLEEEQGARRKVLEAQVAEEEAAAKKTFTRTPSYIKAKDLANIFTEMLGIKAGKGTDDVIFDESTNMVIVRTSPKRMEELDGIMKAMDVKSQQVEIEARVVSANRSFLRDLGVQLGLQAFSNSLNNVVTGVPTSAMNSPLVRAPRPPASSAAPSASAGTTSTGPLPLNVNLGAAAPTSGIGYLYSGGNMLLDAFITASEAKGTARLLSKPKILTQNHVQGVMLQGVQIPVQTNVNNTVSTQFFNFALKLTVTPQITEEGSIFLDANVENSTPDFSHQVQGVPTVNTEQAITRVLVNDGGTVVIGGVLIDQNQINYRMVPGLGNVPVIGNLFKNKSVSTQTQELLFFLTPKILK
jgi:type IV pilus secretin PilQ/predicted competence protein